MKKKFKDISSRSFEHPSDRAALSALRKLTGFDGLIKAIMGFLKDKPLKLMFMSNGIRLNAQQRPEIHALLIEVCKILDVEEVPELFIVHDHRFNAMAVGIERPFIVLNSSLVEGLSTEELKVVIAHEVAHIMSGHVLYKTIHWLLVVAAHYILPKSLMLPTMPVIMALREWDRKSELSADRAGLLVSQDLTLSLQTVFKLAGCSDPKKFNLEEFEKQAKEFEESGTMADSVFKFLNMVFSTHPFPVIRITELKKWHESGEYAAILSGQYLKRSDNPSAPIKNDVVDAVRDYKERFQTSKDPLTSFFRDVYETGEGIFKDAQKKRKSSGE